VKYKPGIMFSEINHKVKNIYIPSTQTKGTIKTQKKKTRL